MVPPWGFSYFKDKSAVAFVVRLSVDGSGTWHAGEDRVKKRQPQGYGRHGRQDSVLVWADTVVNPNRQAEPRVF